MKSILIASVLLLSLLSAGANAAQCDENFSSSGSFLSGKTFKTWADIPNADASTALNNISAYTSGNGFKILSFNPDQGTISAVQATSTNGKKIPLDIAVEGISGGIKVSMIYTTPVGSVSPEGAVKTHFCKTVESATTSQKAMAGSTKLSVNG